MNHQKPFSGGYPPNHPYAKGNPFEPRSPNYGGQGSPFQAAPSSSVSLYDRISQLSSKKTPKNSSPTPQSQFQRQVSQGSPNQSPKPHQLSQQYSGGRNSPNFTSNNDPLRAGGSPFSPPFAHGQSQSTPRFAKQSGGYQGQQGNGGYQGSPNYFQGGDMGNRRFSRGRGNSPHGNFNSRGRGFHKSPFQSRVCISDEKLLVSSL